MVYVPSHLYHMVFELFKVCKIVSRNTYQSFPELRIYSENRIPLGFYFMMITILCEYYTLCWK